MSHRVRTHATLAGGVIAAAVLCVGALIAVPQLSDDADPAGLSASSADDAGCRAADGCFPKPMNTGPGATGIPPNVSLRVCGGDATISTDGTVIDGCIYGGSLEIRARNVTIRNSRVAGGIRTTAEDASFTVEDSELGPEEGCSDQSALVGFGSYVARRNRLRGNGDGFRVGGSNVTITDNFVELCANPGDHSDGIQGYNGGDNVTVHHNTVDQRPAAAGANAPLFFADGSRSCECTDNLLIAVPGGFAIKIHDDHTPDVGPWTITGNRLVGATATTHTECGGAGVTWSDNREVIVDDAYTIVSTGREIGC